MSKTVRPKRDLVIDGVRYRVSREYSVKEGGPEGMSRWPWFALVVDEKHGYCIDQRVPQEHFRTLAECVDAIRRHHREAMR